MSKDYLIKATRELIRPYKIYGKPANEVMGDGQCEIAGSIIFKIAPRVACLAPTGYGKSEAVAVGTSLRAIMKKEEFVIASVKYGTSDIIMTKTIGHLFDDDFLTYQLEVERGMSLQSLKRERRKDHINFREGGGIRIVSLHGKEEDLTKVIGEHVPNIILDESPLLSPAKYFQVLKILEGTGSYDKTFLFELGNAVARNHFMRNVTVNSSYYKINITTEQAIAEGRMDEKSLEEVRGMPFFEQFYLNQFPDEDEVDSRGYRQLLTQDDIQSAMVDEVPKEEDRKLGVDVAGGGDYNTYVIRGAKYAFIDRWNKSNDTMTNITEIEDIMKKQNIPDGEVFIDDIGIGRGVSDRLIEKDLQINSISVGEASIEPDKYKNVKAHAYWELRNWIKGGGKLKRDDRWYQLTWIKYKINSDKVLQIEPKQDLKKREGKSPDFAEALMLTFAPSFPVGMEIL